MYCVKTSLFLIFVQIVASNSFENDIVTIGDVEYKMQKVQLGDYSNRNFYRIGLNSKGDLFLWDDATIFALYKGADEVVRVDGIKYRVNHGFAIDSHDNLIFCRKYDGLFVMKDGSEYLLPVYSMPDTMAIDIHDNLYLGGAYFVDKVKMFDNYSASAEYLNGFEKGFRVPPAIDSKGNIYFRESFITFYYQNINEGVSSRRVIPEIPKYKAMGASCDSKDNVLVASEDGLYWIEKYTKGERIKKIMKFDNIKINGVHVDWFNNDDVYLHIDGFGLYRLIAQ